MRIKTHESQQVVNNLLNTTFNHDKLFPIIVAYVIAMKMPLIIHEDETPIDSYNKLDTNVISYLLDDLNTIVPFDLMASESYVKGFYQWRYSVAIGHIGGDVKDIEDIFTRQGKFLPSQFHELLEAYPDKIRIQRTLSGVTKLIGELNESFK